MDTIKQVLAGNSMLFTLGVMMALDILTGICVGVIERRISSKISFAGMARKTIVVLLVGMAASIDRMNPDAHLTTLVCGFFIATEAISILENAAKAGVPIPKPLKDALDTMRSVLPPGAKGNEPGAKSSEPGAR